MFKLSYLVKYFITASRWNKLVEIRERVFTEIKEKPHKYKTPARALGDLLDGYEENENAIKIIPEIFKMSTDELKLKGFLDNEYAEDDYVDLEYYFFAIQYACDLILHYVEEYNLKSKSNKEYIKPQIKDIRIIENISLLSSSVNPSKQDIMNFTPDVIPDAQDGVEAS